MKKLFLLCALCTYGMMSAQVIDANKILTYLEFEENLNESSANTAVSYVEYTENEVGGTTYTGNALTYEDGKFGKAAHFDTSMVRSNELAFNPESSFTMGAWIKLTDTTYKADGSVIPTTIVHQKDLNEDGTDAGAPGRIHIEATRVTNPGDSMKWGSFTDGQRCDDSTQVVVHDVWYHVVNVKDVDANTRSLYVNGVNVNSIECKDPDESNTGQLIIGGSKNMKFANPFRGSIDDFFITEEVLDQAAIQAVMNHSVAIASTQDITSLHAVDANNFKCYYANNTLHTSFNETIEQVSIYSISGKLIKAKAVNASNVAISLSAKAGIYIINAKTTTGKVASAFVVD